VAIVYFSPRLLCRFDLAVRAISIRRRIASERKGLHPAASVVLVDELDRRVALMAASGFYRSNWVRCAG
jgi:hypothetical protein